MRTSTGQSTCHPTLASSSRRSQPTRCQRGYRSTIRCGYRSTIRCLISPVPTGRLLRAVIFPAGLLRTRRFIRGLATAPAQRQHHNCDFSIVWVWCLHAKPRHSKQRTFNWASRQHPVSANIAKTTVQASPWEKQTSSPVPNANLSRRSAAETPEVRHQHL